MNVEYEYVFVNGDLDIDLSLIHIYIRTNAVLGPQEIGHYVELGERERKMMELAFERIGLTARTYHKILRVARTIADLDYSEKVKEKHLKEAIAYRSLDKKYWGR